MRYSIGTTYEGKNLKYLQAIIPYVDHLEISPDALAIRKNGHLSINPESLQQLKWVQRETDIEILIHGVGLSIGSYDGYSTEYLELLDELFSQLSSISWHSEHLAYTKVGGENLGTMLALPRTEEVVEMICRRVDKLQSRYKVPFLLENVISMLPSPDSQYTDAAFLNEITDRTGCKLILDVYNIECDEVNFCLQVEPFLQELNLSTVYEIHLAGGTSDEEFHFQMDIHSQLVAESTFNLARRILGANKTGVKAITFEILEEFIESHGSVAIINELNKLNYLFNGHEPANAAN